MTAPMLRRPAPCLFCVFAAARCAPRLGPRIQKAYRSDRADAGAAEKRSHPENDRGLPIRRIDPASRKKTAGVFRFTPGKSGPVKSLPGKYGPPEKSGVLRFTPEKSGGARFPTEKSGPARSPTENSDPPRFTIYRGATFRGGSKFASGRTPPFDVAARMALEKVKLHSSSPEFLESSSLTMAEFEREWAKYEEYVARWIRHKTPEVRALEADYRKGPRSLLTRMKYLFYAQVFGSRFTRAETDNQKEIADLRHPAEWYPATRAMKRIVHMHVGPTNSGKTYHALKRLETAQKGIYLGPLRLLAHEVYSRLNAKGRLCALVTGEEQRMPANDEVPEMYSCTVEMAPLNLDLDVAVIDEIQMINHKERGWAWTQAFMGLCAKEVHVCGEARTVPLLKELCGLTGDEVHVHEYERLTPLVPADKSLDGNLTKNLKKGDCIVSFSVLGIHALRKQIENATNRKCAIVYGSLPPETRAQQARLFNDPDNDYDFLVASDAIGMGLNLSIKRVILETTMKNNGQRLVPLEVSDLKQIAGRAGRYRSAHEAMAEDEAETSAAEEAKKDEDQVQATAAEEAIAAPVDAAIGLDDAIPQPPAEVKNDEAEHDFASRAPKDTKTVGVATTLEAVDLPFLKRALQNDPEPITTAGLFPPAMVVERFASYFPPGTPFSYILLRLHDISVLHPRYHLCSLKDSLIIADAIHVVKNLTVQERLTFCAAPTSLKTDAERSLIVALARCVADNESGDLLDLPIPLEVLDAPPSGTRQYLASLEDLHKMVVQYLWLAHRFGNVFNTRGLANYAKLLVEEAIEKTLTEFNYTDEAYGRLRKKRVRAMAEHELTQQEPEASVEDLDSEKGKVPEAMLDVLKDKDVFDSEPKPDDVNEYPTPELELDERKNVSV